MKTKRNLNILAYFFTAILIILSMITAKAGVLTVTWVGGGMPLPNSWSNASNWSAGSVPGPTDIVTIPNSIFSPVLDVTTTIGGLTMGQPNADLTLDGIHNLTVAGDVNVMATASILTAHSTITIGGNLSGLGKIDLTVHGTLIVSGNMSITTLISGTGGNSLVIFNGSSQNICGSYQFNNLQAGPGASTATVNFLADETVNNALTGNGTVVCHNHTLNITGDMSVKNFIPDSGTVNLTGYINSQYQNINGYNFYNLSIDNNGTYLNGNVSILNNLNFISGNAILGSNNLTIQSPASITWKGSTTATPAFGYLVTGGTGHLTMTAAPALTVFPVGNSASEYNPVTITSSSGNVIFDVNVSDGVTDATGAAITSSAVNETWLIVPHTSATVAIYTQWTDGSKGDANQELFGFNRTLAQLNDRTANPSPWMPIGPAGSATGGDPWTLGSSSLSVTGSVPYSLSVGGPPAPLPVTLISFDAVYQGGVVNLAWKTVSEINNDRFEIERSANGKDWTKIGETPGHGNSQIENEYS